MQSSSNNSQNNKVAISVAPSPEMARGTPRITDGVQEKQDAQPAQLHNNWRGWFTAVQRILPIYLATHIAFLLLTYLVSLFFLDNFSPRALKLDGLVELWNHWDTSQFTGIATVGYNEAWRTAFFPLYPLLEAGLKRVTHNPYYAGLIISNLATLGLFTVLYRLVQEDANEEQAYRTVLYLAVFPTAFFLAAAYNESLFLFLAVSSFYSMRRGHWWLAGLCGFLASLTRSAGVFLLIPFCYEYLRQHDFKLRKLRFSVVGALLIPAGLALFSLYCSIHMHDALAFSHAQTFWKRHLALPWSGYSDAISIITKHSVLTFDSIHNVIDLTVGLFMLVILVLGFAGPWRFSRERIVYGLYGVAFYLFLVLFPSASEFPLQSLSRLVIELFPAFIVLAAMGKRSSFNLYYLTLSISVLAFMLLQFLMGRWIV